MFRNRSQVLSLPMVLRIYSACCRTASSPTCFPVAFLLNMPRMTLSCLNLRFFIRRAACWAISLLACSYSGVTVACILIHCSRLPIVLATSASFLSSGSFWLILLNARYTCERDSGAAVVSPVASRSAMVSAVSSLPFSISCVAAPGRLARKSGSSRGAGSPRTRLFSPALNRMIFCFAGT